MSTFAVTIKSIRAIEPHPNADAIEFAVIDGYRSIVKKGEFRPGALVAYIPESALLPEWMLKHMGLWDADKNCGKLHGKAGNRVKAIKLRGELSQGICYPVDAAVFTSEYDLGADEAEHNTGFVLHVDPAALGVKGFVVHENDDVTETLGITKYEPPIPVSLSGEVFNAGQHLTTSFDVENWKSYPDVLQDGEMVIFTEKLHGTFTGVAVLPIQDAHPEAFGKNRNILLFSKGLGSKGLVFKNNDRNARNLYVRATRALMDTLGSLELDNTTPILFMGETFGPGVQDLVYGKEIGFRLFAVARGYRENQTYLNYDEMVEMGNRLGVATVPLLYRGPFSEAVMREYTDGKTTLGAEHIREGIVMVPEKERYDPRIGRVCLKSVSADYLTRKGGTEYN